MDASKKGMPPPASVSIGSKIAPEQAAQIRELIEAGLYLDESDFVRDAIRHRLSEIKVIKCREVDFQTAGFAQNIGEQVHADVGDDFDDIAIGKTGVTGFD